MHRFSRMHQIQKKQTKFCVIKKSRYVIFKPMFLQIILPRRIEKAEKGKSTIFIFTQMNPLAYIYHIY